MKKILILGVALLAMVSCKKYDDSELWDAVKKLQADTVKEESVANVVPIEKGAIKAAFSIGENKQVYFSQGNLQYKASTGVWRFAVNQWDIIGEDNANVAPDYDGWIDLFGWGTSGWNSGANEFMPYATSKVDTDYYPGGLASNNLTGSCANADWGVYNKIANGGNQTGLWRTLSKDEWVYLFQERTNASSLSGLATVNGVNGLVLLPDNWSVPQGIEDFTSISQVGDNIDMFQTINSYNIIQWTKMEDAGAIFLPASGNRSRNVVSGVGVYNGYWSSTAKDESMAYLFSFAGTSKPDLLRDRFYGRAVRLVQDVK